MLRFQPLVRFCLVLQAPLHQLARLSPLHMHFPHSQLQAEGVREGRAAVQNKTSVLPF